MRKIADRVGYRTPVVYEYFESKDDLILELLRRGFAELREAMRAARVGTPDPEEALYDMTRAYLRFAWGSPDLYQVMYGLGGVSFVASEAGEEGGRRIGDEAGLAVEGVMRGYGKNATDVSERVFGLWSTAHGLAALVLAGLMPGGEEQAERLGERAVRDALLAWRSE